MTKPTNSPLTGLFSPRSTMRARTTTTAALTVVAGALILSACAPTSTKTANGSSTPNSAGSASTASQAPLSASPTPSKPNYTNMPLGNSITVTGKNYSGGSAVDSSLTLTVGTPQTSKKAVSQYGSAPKGTFVGLTVTYDCTTGKCDYNPFDFTMRAADGTEAQASYGEGFDPQLNSGTIGAGSKAKGVITYDLMPGTYSLEYRTNLLDGDAASWTIPVA